MLRCELMVTLTTVQRALTRRLGAGGGTLRKHLLIFVGSVTMCATATIKLGWAVCCVVLEAAGGSRTQ